MKIGLVYYSQSGNTRQVAGKIKDKLVDSGHEVTLDEITITGKSPAQPRQFQLNHVPAVEGYEAVIFGAPVQAFSLNPAMIAYMSQLPSLSGKKVACFVTKQLPLLFVGGTGAIARMKKEVESRGANLVGTDIVVWAESKRDKTTKQCIENMGKYF
ncbi:MAG: flavodoxin family protein [Bacillota bacterium]|nr:flavodoxin family protein [Bacillota bacterium]